MPLFKIQATRQQFTTVVVEAPDADSAEDAINSLHFEIHDRYWEDDHGSVGVDTVEEVSPQDAKPYPLMGTVDPDEE